MFGPDGGLVANAPHIPVHLGAMQETVQYQVLWYNSSYRHLTISGILLWANLCELLPRNTPYMPNFTPLQQIVKKAETSPEMNSP